mmetsp:Transcript_33232/g.68600  ORF Transcript_33232/g.68600 Transcript_33232/m.68600 type:complete len:239 (-) Transcript_33232:439-1155(-)
MKSARARRRRKRTTLSTSLPAPPACTSTPSIRLFSDESSSSARSVLVWIWSSITVCTTASSSISRATPFSRPSPLRMASKVFSIFESLSAASISPCCKSSFSTATISPPAPRPEAAAFGFAGLHSEPDWKREETPPDDEELFAGELAAAACRAPHRRRSCSRQASTFLSSSSTSLPCSLPPPPAARLSGLPSSFALLRFSRHICSWALCSRSATMASSLSSLLTLAEAAIPSTVLAFP